MATARITPDLEMYYEVDDFAAPWRVHETVLLAHGNAESSAVWYGWVPRLAAELRVVRPDMRGFGHSTPMPVDHAWSASRIADDYIELMDQLGCARGKPEFRTRSWSPCPATATTSPPRRLSAVPRKCSTS